VKSHRLLLPLILLYPAAASSGQVVAAPAPAPALAAAPYKNIWQTTPLGFLQFGPTVEYQQLVAPNIAVMGLIRLTSFGLIPRLIAASEDDALDLGGNIGGAALFYPGKSGIGWFVGPHLEIGSSPSRDYTASVHAYATEFGYRWIKPSNLTMSFGAASGLFTSAYQSRLSPSDKGTDIYPFFMAIFTVGRAR
jgi:hypothetical protein